jgi:membrane protein YqaA with SNARE-associated domain
MAVHETHPYSRMVRWMSKWGDLTIFLLALLPNPLFDIAGITAGVLKYPVWRFILLGAAGRIPKHILFAYLGHWGVGFFPM